MQHILLGLYPWELQLPWAPLTLKYGAGARLERVGRGRGPACARGVIVNICRRVGTSATVTTQTVSGKSVVGRRRDARPRIARMARLDLAMPRRNGSAVDEPRPRPRSLTAPKLLPCVVTQQKLFFPSLMRSARVPRSPRKLASQPGTLLLLRLPSGRSERAGPRTQMALSQYVGWA